VQELAFDHVGGAVAPHLGCGGGGAVQLLTLLLEKHPLIPWEEIYEEKLFPRPEDIATGLVRI
jgi:hypothetical protein